MKQDLCHSHLAFAGTCSCPHYHHFYCCCCYVTEPSQLCNPIWDLRLDCCCAEDVYDAVLRAGARLNLPILPLAERIPGQKWDLPSPPPKASPWVDEMCMHLQMFGERLRQIKSLTNPNLLQVGVVHKRLPLQC